MYGTYSLIRNSDKDGLNFKRGLLTIIFQNIGVLKMNYVGCVSLS